MVMRFSTVCAVIVAMFAAMGCTRNLASDNYAAADVGEAIATYAGQVIHVRKVQIQEGDTLDQNTTGASIGAVAGGLSGYMIGSDRGHVLAQGVGTIAGGVMGAMAQRELSKQEGLEYTVRLDSGSTVTIVQGNDHPLSVGQRVSVHVGSRNRSRVIAA